MNEREKWVFAIDFLRKKGDPVTLRRAFEWEKLCAVLHYVREGIPNHYALTDRVMYKQVMDHIINLRIFGWANPHWEFYEHYAKDPSLVQKSIEKIREKHRLEKEKLNQQNIQKEIKNNL